MRRASVLSSATPTPPREAAASTRFVAVALVRRCCRYFRLATIQSSSRVSTASSPSHGDTAPAFTPGERCLIWYLGMVVCVHCPEHNDFEVGLVWLAVPPDRRGGGRTLGECEEFLLWEGGADDAAEAQKTRNIDVLFCFCWRTSSESS